MTRKQPRQIPSTSLFPFFTERVEHPYFGYMLAGTYFVVLAAINLKYHIVGDYGVETDFFWSYVPQAKHVLEGTLTIEDFHGPLYPIILALVGLVTKDFFHAGVLLATFAAATTLFFVFELFKRLFRADTALIAVLIVGANTTFVQYTYSAGTDMLFNAFVTGGAFFLFLDEERSWKTLSISTLFFALCYLTRYNGIFVLLGVPAAIVIGNHWHLDQKERWKMAAIFAGLFLGMIAPWGIYCWIEKGSFFYNRNYLNIAYEMFAKGRMGWDQYWSVESQKFTSLTQVIFTDPGLFISTLAANVAEHLVNDLDKLLGWHVAVFSVVGLVLSFKQRPGARLLGFGILSLAFFGVLLLVFYGERFSMFLLPFYIALALQPLVHPSLARMKLWNRIQVGALIAMGLVVWTGSKSYSFNKDNIRSGPQEMIAIADWCDRNLDNSERGKNIFARKPHIAYYLRMQMQGFPYVNTYPELVAAMKSQNASYVYFSLMEAAMRPQFQNLLDPKNAPKELQPVTFTAYPPAVLYKVRLDSLQ